MEAENQVFIYRAGQLPVVKAAYESAASAYEATKNYNRLLGAALQLAESGVKYASETETAKKVLQSSLMAVANNIAMGQLDKLEENYPSVKKTPNELWDVGKEYYEQSRVKGGVDKIYAVKDYSVAKVDDTKKYCHSIVTGDVTVFKAVTDLSRCTLLLLNELLDYSDAFIDKYVAVEGSSRAHNFDSGEFSCADRIQLMSGKVYDGLKYRAVTKYGETKEYVVKTLGDLHTAMILVEYAKNTAAWANEKAMSTLATAQEQTKALWNEIQRNAQAVGKRSEVVLLNLVQGLTFCMASLSDQIVKYSSPYLPESAEKKLAAAVGYAHEMEKAFSKAKNLGDLRDEVIAQTKDKIAVVQDGLVNAIEYFADFPPACWLAVDLDGMELSETEEELINMDRETRRPGSPRFLLPIIQPRHENHIQSG